MSNRFEQVDEIQLDSITVVMQQRPDGQWANVHCPAAATSHRLPKDYASESMAPIDALVNAVALANELKLAIVVVDRDGLWKPQWGELYRFEDEETSEPDAPEA